MTAGRIVSPSWFIAQSFPFAAIGYLRKALERLSRFGRMGVPALGAKSFLTRTASSDYGRWVRSLSYFLSPRVSLHAAAVAILITLGGCASKPSVQTSTRCAPLVEYDPQFQAAVVEEWDKLSWRVRKLLNDYGSLRAQCRAMDK